ncbi:hypothetical protein, partial [Gordonia sputi]|uniref:hypothetical protein n=2 Tax=Gordonia TaxID=2053 RepID=UPI001C3F2C05
KVRGITAFMGVLVGSQSNFVLAGPVLREVFGSGELFVRCSCSFAAGYLALSSDEMIVACRLVRELRPHLDSARRVISRTAFLRYSD